MYLTGKDRATFSSIKSIQGITELIKIYGTQVFTKLGKSKLLIHRSKIQIKVLFGINEHKVKQKQSKSMLYR